MGKLVGPGVGIGFGVGSPVGINVGMSVGLRVGADVSRKQDALQPSPDTLFPSSHVSGGSITPSPQVGTQVERVPSAALHTVAI